MSGSLIDLGHALGPADRTFSPDSPDFAVHRIVEDDPHAPVVIVENPAGQRFGLERGFAASIALPPPPSQTYDAGRKR